MLDNAGLLDSWQWLMRLTDALRVILPTTLAPRFILDLRELYAHDLQGRRGSHVDTAFGFGLDSLGHDTIGDAIVFADPRQNESDEQSTERSDEIQMDEVQEVCRANSCV